MRHQQQQQQRCSHGCPTSSLQPRLHKNSLLRLRQLAGVVCNSQATGGGGGGGAAQQQAAGARTAAPPQQPSSTWVWEESEDGAAAYAVFFAWLALGALPAVQSIHVVDPALVYFVGLGILTVYIGSHRGLTSKSRQQLSMKEVRTASACLLHNAPEVPCSPTGPDFVTVRRKHHTPSPPLTCTI